MCNVYLFMDRKKKGKMIDIVGLDVEEHVLESEHQKVVDETKRLLRTGADVEMVRTSVRRQLALQVALSRKRDDLRKRRDPHDSPSFPSSPSSPSSSHLSDPSWSSSQTLTF